MPLGIHNPLPGSVASECKKCGKILASFVDPRQAFGPDKIIPPQILANAKGLAILTVIKAGFLGSGRYGNGVVVARLADGSWSAPSAIGTGGAGFGGQIGFELTDFVFILNDAAAVRTFSQAGSLTLGGNVSIAAGPIGRNAEAAGAASTRGVAGIFAYSKTKGLFAGVSLEGSAIIERRDANEKLYGQRFTARQLLEGAVRPPPAAAPLMNVLNSRVFAGVRAGDDAMYNDIPVYDDRHDDVVWEGKRGSGMGEGVRRDRTGSVSETPRGNPSDYVYSDKPKRASTWADDIYDRPTGAGRTRTATGFDDEYVYSDNASRSSNGPGPGRPAAAKPIFQSKTGSLRDNQAVALFTFDADQPGDLGFKKGDIITVTKKTDSTNDWWTGIIGTRTGIFPSNYVEMKK
ncbi:putative YSC84 [Coleophoma cylindrospora]|uniref:Putative YSC84 n=1 Tax=Coleophoma cylindrospora TaxID=1849047 RepID=A0A3D8RMU2_9HELO|nr:putative YSC84 [Coleophoma cylindrospora]